jgi:hypothetical protein
MNLTLQAKSLFHSLIGKVDPYQNQSTGTIPDLLNGLFSFSLRSFPDSYVTNGSITDFTSFHYERKLHSLEKGIFDKLDVRLVTANTQRIILSSQLETAKLVPALEKLVWELHLRYGKDDVGYTGFTSKDRECLLKGGYWSGRLWHRTAGKSALSLNLYADDKGVLLTMFIPRT